MLAVIWGTLFAVNSFLLLMSTVGAHVMATTATGLMQASLIGCLFVFNDWYQYEKELEERASNLRWDRDYYQDIYRLCAG